MLHKTLEDGPLLKQPPVALDEDADVNLLIAGALYLSIPLPLGATTCATIY